MAITPESRIVILTGAGISRESGIDTFRDAGGIWSKVRLEDVCTPEALAADRERVNAFYNARREHLLTQDIRANAAHQALAKLEREHAGPCNLVTQNIDHLHEDGGSEEVLHMHGELLKVRCEACEQCFEWKSAIDVGTQCPDCGAIDTLRPHVVFFGEMPLEMGRIMAWLSSCDLFISIGTSGSVYPAAGFVEVAQSAGAHTVELNLEPSEGASSFAEKHYGPATEVVPAYVESLLTASA